MSFIKFKISGMLGIPATCVLLAACSAPSVLVNAKTGGKTTSNPKAPNTSTSGDEDWERPTIDVAGVNLVGQCDLLSAAGLMPDTQSISCSLQSQESNVEVSFQNPSLLIPGETTPLVANGTSAPAGKLKSSNFVIPKDRPMSFHFDVPKRLVTGISLEWSKLSFGKFAKAESGDGSPVELKLPMRTFETHPACQESDVKTAKTDLKFNSKYDSAKNGVINPSSKTTTAATHYLHNKIILKPEKTWSYFAPSVSQEKIKICSARFDDKISVKWKKLSSNIGNLKQFARIGNILLFSSASQITRATYTHTNSRVGWIGDVPGIENRIESITSFDNDRWCIYGLNNCFPESTSDTNQSFDLRGLSGEVLLLAAKNLLAGTEGSELVLSTHEVSDNSANKNSTQQSTVDDGPTSSTPSANLSFAGENGVGPKKIEVESAQVEFSVKYVVLP